MTRPTYEDAGPDLVIDAGVPSPDADAPPTLPHVVLAATPTHGPFSGGTLVSLRGNGFAGDVRVWFGENQVPPGDVVAIDPHRLQVTSPPGPAGLSDIRVQNGDDESTRAVLRGGFGYDAFYADPASGPTSGGTLVTLHGQGTSWSAETTVSIDRNPCEVVELISEAELVCRAPAGTQGAKTVRVTTPGQAPFELFDGYAYGDTDNGFRGGLSGAPLSRELKVLVYDSVFGDAIPNAHVIVGADDPLVARTDPNGVALVDVASAVRPTVTIARKCFQPITFAAVPVSTVTVYLDPVLSVSCFSPEGDLENAGGTPGRRASIDGELVWPETQEFRRDNWSSVPEPKSPNESKAAYVFALASRAEQAFSLPSALLAVTPESAGTTGYSFSLSTNPGTQTLYALAGIENRGKNPPQFTAYAMGLVRGVAAPASTTVSDVFIRVDALLDHSFTIELTPPKRTRRGPDRVQAQLAVRVGAEGYALLPQGRREALLGEGTQSLSFVGVAALTGSLTGTSYVASMQAVSGAGGLPRSVLALQRVSASVDQLLAGPFLQVPVLSAPAPNGLWNGRDLSWDYAAGGLVPSLAILEVASASGLYNWRVVAPGDVSALRMPDLGEIDADLGWPRGEQVVQVTLASLPNFQYGALRYRDLTTRNWVAHASDSASASY